MAEGDAAAAAIGARVFARASRVSGVLRVPFPRTVYVLWTCSYASVAQRAGREGRFVRRGAARINARRDGRPLATESADLDE